MSGASEFEKFAEDDEKDDFGSFKQDTIPEKDIF